MIRLGDRPVFLQGLSIPDRLVHGLPMFEGNLADAAESLASGRGVLLSDNLAYRLGVHAGDTLAVPTPDGNRRFVIEGTFADYLGSIDLGAIAVAYEQLGAIWGDPRSTTLRLWLRPDANPSTVRAEVRRAMGGDGVYYVLSAREFLDAVRSALDQMFLASCGLVLTAALVCVISILNAQAAAVVDRATEITTLRLIGVPPRTVAASIVAECATVGFVGGAGGSLLGLMFGVQMVGWALRALTGWRMPFLVPTGAVIGMVAGCVLISTLAGWIPARMSDRVDARLRSDD